MSEQYRKSPNFHPFWGMPAMKFDRPSPFRFNPTPLGKFSTACSVFP